MASFYQKGDRILDRYVVDSFAGGGGVGEVYLCRMGGDVFALKALNPRVVGAFLNDTRLQDALESDRPDSDLLVAVRDIERDDDRFVVVTDWVDGWDLRRAMTARADAGGRFTAEEALAVVDTLLDEIAVWPSFAVHGALKPENILLPGVHSDLWTRHPSLRITDYGLRRVVTFSKYASVALTRGKPYRYLAPEFVGTGGDIDRRADVYSVAALAYELLTGDAPRKDAAPASSFGPQVPPALDAVFARALAPVADRYTNAAELRDALREAVPEILKQADERPVEVGSIDLFSGELMQSVKVRVEDLDAVDVFAVESEEATPPAAAASPAVAESSGHDRDLLDMDRVFDRALSPEAKAAQPADSAAAPAETDAEAVAGDGETPSTPEVSAPFDPEQGESRLLVYLLVAAATLALVFLLLRYRQGAERTAPLPPPVVVQTPTPAPTPEATPEVTPEPTPEPTATPTPTPKTTPTPTPTPTATPTPTPEATPEPTPESPPAPTPTPEPADTPAAP